MIRIIIFFLLFFGIIVNAQSFEKEIYSKIVNKFKENKIAIKDSTSIGHMELSEYEFESIKESLIDIERETFDSFIEQNKIPSKLNIEFKTNKNVVWFTSDEMKNLFVKGKGWTEFYDKYGKTQGILTFSKIGFNKSKTQALIYYGNQSQWLAGSGHLVLFEKINGIWKLSLSTMLWIS